MKFFKNIGTTLLVFNFISIFFLLITLFAYSIIQYLFEPLVAITDMLFSTIVLQNILYRILNLVFILPTYLDYCFLLIVISFTINIFYLSFKTEKANIYYTLLFSLIGLPTYIYFLKIMNGLKEWALGFIQSAIVDNVNMRFFNYIVNNSIEFTIFVFIIAIFIRSTDWENVKLFKNNPTNTLSTPDDKNLKEIFKQ